MLTENTYQFQQVVDKENQFTTFSLGIAAQPRHELEVLLANLTPNTPWDKRQLAAKKLGYLRDPEALPGLLVALPVDPFWMVRCAIIQALEMISDARAIPVLQEVAEHDDFQVVQAYATKAIDRLSR